MQLFEPGLRLNFGGETRVARLENLMANNGSKPKSATYKKILENKAEEVRRSMSAQKAAQVVSRLDVPSDEGDLSQQSHEEWIFLNRNTIDSKLLREIGEALHRLEIGTYGICMECEEPISAKRLEALPWAKYCVTCQERIAQMIESGEYSGELEGAGR